MQALADAQGDDDAENAANVAKIAQLKAQLASQRAAFQAQIRNLQVKAPPKGKQDLELMKLLENQLVDKQAEVRQQNRETTVLEDIAP